MWERSGLVTEGLPAKTSGYTADPATSRNPKAVEPTFDTSAPWQFLALRSYPRHHSDSPGPWSGYRQEYCNGPFAFLSSLEAEYREAVDRCATLQRHFEQIIELSVSPLIPLESLNLTGS